jgi:tyrosinase
LAAASMASAASLPKRVWNSGFSVPSSGFQNFQVVTLEDARQGKDREIQGLPANGTQPENAHAENEDVSTFSATATTSDAASCSANPSVHQEWRSYSTSDRLAFVSAVKCLMNTPPSGNFPPATSRYEDLVRLHQEYMPEVHNNAKFLIWHRYYMWTFEQVLRTECGFDRDMVWWDETLDAGRFAQSDMFTNPNYFGSLPTPDSNGNPSCINDGAFGGLTCNIGPGQDTTPHCLSRGVNEDYTSQCNQDFINYCNERTDYADYEPCLEYG